MLKNNFDKLIRNLKSGRKPLLAVLIDPDKYKPELIDLADELKVSCFLAGGSSINSGNMLKTIKDIRKRSNIPVVLFPGDETQLVREADGLLLISLLSGRNPEYLIGKHVKAAPVIRKLKLPLLPTAYLLIGKNGRSSTEKVSRTEPIAADDIQTVINTALAAEQLGFKALYLEAGSGAGEPIKGKLIRKVKQAVRLPLIVGGGINTAAKAKTALKAGASMIVIGNALEKDIYLLRSISSVLHTH
jgi:phosphoglycerol geranylgeranyltransferase